ncbi:MAG: AtpZ/AtpI family protein, partial [Proteobacteria bacterium]|nr:AtpZ/AtpI family protein [Pseudomonadota bacterium]
MSEGPDPKRLDALGKKLDAVKQAKQPEVAEESHYTAARVGWQMVTELVVGLLLGFGIGYGIDYMADTRPWFMLIFTMLGFAAGVRTMMRTAQEIQ